MHILNRLVFAHAILINFKLCHSKVYLYPDNGYDFPKSIGYDDKDIIIVDLSNHNLEDDGELKSNLKEVVKYDSLEDIETMQEIDELNLNGIQKNVLRKEWRSSCDKKASKTCIKACKSAYKIVCGSYNCKRKMKKEFRRECKRNCKAKFISTVSSETE